MADSNEQQIDFEAVKTRLAEIAEAVDDEALSLDDALGLYEEAVALGLKASDLLETGVVVPEEPAESEASVVSTDPAGAVDAPAASPQASEGETPTGSDQQFAPAAV